MLFEGVLVKLAPKMHPLSKVLFFKRTPFLAHAFRVHAFSSARFLERTLYINKVIFFQFNSGLACRWPHLHIQLEFTGGILWPSNFLCGLGYCLPRLFSKQSFERYWMCNESWWRFQEKFRRLFVWRIDRGWIQGVGCYGQSLDQFCHLWVNYNFCKRKTRRENLNFLFQNSNAIYRSKFATFGSMELWKPCVFAIWGHDWWTRQNCLWLQKNLFFKATFLVKIQEVKK